MSSLSRSGRSGNGKSLLVLLTNDKAGIVESFDVADDLNALAAWLVKMKAEPQGTCTQFFVKRRGQELRVIVTRDGRFHWQWRYLRDVVLPRFERAKRLASLPKIRPVSKRRKPAAA